MKLALIFVFTFSLVASAHAAPIAPSDAKSHVGQSVTVEGAVSNVHVARSGMVFIDMGGEYPDNPFTGVIFAEDAAAFKNIEQLDGETIDMTGEIELYQGRPEIVLKSPGQIKVR